MTLSATMFGTETRIGPLVRTVIVITAMRALWIAINREHPDIMVLPRALVPWPVRSYSLTVWAADLALLFYQLRAILRLARPLLWHHAPAVARVLRLPLRGTSGKQALRPRHRSWLPTALQLSGLLILTCCIVTWLVLMLAYGEWAPFDLFMLTFFANRAILVGMALSLLGLMFGGRYVARASGDVGAIFRVVRVDERHWLTQRVHVLADKLDLPKPSVGVTDVTNAFAVGARRKSSLVVIGKPLLALEPDELDAIIGHELGHILHNDVARMQFAEGFQRMLVTVVNAATVLGLVMARSAANNRRNAQLGASVAVGSGAIVRHTVFIASELVAKGISRTREFHADAVGAHLTSVDAMARALQRVHGVDIKPTPGERQYGYLMFRGAGFGHLFATHPPLAARLKALEALGHRSAADAAGC